MQLPQENAKDFERMLVLRLALSLHSEPCLRRASFRHSALPNDRHCFAGIRLVLAPR